jgi:hypothetical protein
MADYAIEFEILISTKLFIEKREDKIDSYTFRNLADYYNTDLDETRALLVSLCIKRALMNEENDELLMSFKDRLLEEIQNGSNSKNNIIECINYFQKINNQ